MLSVLVTETAINEVGKHNLFNQIKKKLNQKKIDFKIVTFKSLETKKDYSYRSLKVEVIKTKKYSSKLLNSIKTFNELVKLKPNHLIIGGYGYLQNWSALLYAIIFRKKKTIWTGASETTSLNNSLYYNFLKSLFVKNFDNSIVYGTKSMKYLKKLGFKKKIFLTNNISDIEFFSKNIPNNKIKIKGNTKVPKFVYCARLVEHKGIEYLIKTFQKFKKNKYHLTIIGDGPLRKLVISKINDKLINAKYYLKLSQHKLSKIFKNTDFFISTTFNDPFSRTLSEAISSGCYCISSTYDDASHDLINRNNGVIYDPKKYNSLFYILNKILYYPQKYKIKKKLFKKINFNTDLYSSICTKCILDAIND